MEVFGAVVAALGLVREVAGLIDCYKESYEDRARLQIFLRTIESSLQVFETSNELLPSDIWVNRLQSLQNEQGGLAEFNGLLRSLQLKLQPRPHAHRLSSSGGSSKTSALIQGLRWPLEKERVHKVIKELLHFHQGLLGIQSQLLHDMTDFRLKGLEDIILSKFKKEELENHLSWLSENGISDQSPDEANHGPIVKPRWFWSNAIFRAWEEGNPHGEFGSMLFCPGELGVGKTFFVRCLGESLREKYPAKGWATAVFYFNYKQQQLHTPENVFGHICKQILFQDPGTQPIVKAHREGQKEHFQHKRLVILAKDLLAALEGSFIIFDAFDECSTRHASDILNIARDVLSTTPRLRLLVTGRHSCRAHFVGEPSMEIVATNTDIEQYIRSRLPATTLGTTLPFIGPLGKDHSRILGRLVDQSGCRFLLARGHMNAVQGSFSLSSLESKIDKLGSDIDDVYEKCLERIKLYQPGDFGALGLTALIWVIHARRQLTLDEVLAIHVASSSVGEFDDSTYEALSLDHFIASTAGLIQIDNETSHLSIHKSLQDYFEDPNVRLRHFPDAEHDIAGLCIRLLCSRPPGVYSSQHLTRPSILNYPALNWGYHALPDQRRILPMILDFLLREEPLQKATQLLMAKELGAGCCHWLQPEAKKLALSMHIGNNSSLSAMHIASYFGLDLVVTELTRRGHSVDTKDKFGRTPLHIACFAGNVSIVKLLLQLGSSPYATDIDGRTCVHVAAARGNDMVLSLVLARHSDLVSARGTSGQTALLEAACFDSVPAAAALIKAGACLTDRIERISDYIGGRENLFHLAAEQNVLKIFELVFEADAAIAHTLLLQPLSRHFWGDRPMHTAAYFNNPEVIQLLFTLGAGIEIRQNSGQTPLLIACQHGRLGAAVMLLELGAKLGVMDEWSMTPLHHAARNGHVDILRVLLQRSECIEDIDRPCDPDGDTPLHLAAASAFGCTRGYYPYITIPETVRNETYLECFKLLHLAGASLEAKNVNDKGESVLDVARKGRNGKIINYIEMARKR